MTDTASTLPGLPGGPPLSGIPVPALEWSPRAAPRPDGLWQPEPIKLPARTPRPTIPLFDLTEEVCEAASVAEREAIIEDMAARGTLHLPFERIAVRFPMDQISSALNWRQMEANNKGIHCTFAVTGPVEIANFYSSKLELPDDESRWVDPDDEKTKAEIAAGLTRKMRVVSARGGMAANWIIENQYGVSVMDLNEHKDVPGFLANYFGMAEEALTILLASLACKNVERTASYNGQIGRGAHAIPVCQNGGVTFISMTKVRPPRLTDGHSGAIMKPHMRRGHEHTVVHGKGRTLRRVQWFAPTYVGYDPALAPPAPHEYRVTA